VRRMVKTSPEKVSAEDHGPPTRKMTREELDRTSTRLTQPYPRPEIKDPIALSPRIVKDKEVIDQSVERLYRQGMEHKKKQLEDAAQHQHDKFTPTKTVRSAEELEEGLGRLYTQAIEQKKQSDSKARQQFLFHHHGKPAQLSVEELTGRVYTESIKKHKEEEQRLHDKYVEGTAVKCRKLTKDEVKASADRLCSKK
jgi:hypothetical protein